MVFLHHLIGHLVQHNTLWLGSSIHRIVEFDFTALLTYLSLNKKFMRVPKHFYQTKPN